ncbi:MAG TPA: YfhO family protein, partial [Patescibacteria group bacterium]|nr:YfhO family protein [Patescibacteria group bacterium]
KRYGELVATSLDGNIPEKIPRTDVVIYPGYGPDDLKNNQYRKRILDLLGVSYIIYARNPMEADEPDKITFPEDRYRFLYNDEQVQIYENKDALPRIFLAGEVLVEKNPEAIMTKIFDQKVDLRKTVILEEDLPMNLLPEKDPNAQLRLIAYEPNKIVIQTTASKNQMLFLSDTFFPGWKAMVDEREQQLYRADYAFRAVALSPGEHTVVFSYRPESFYWGMIISISTFTFMMIGWFFLRKKLV